MAMKRTLLFACVGLVLMVGASSAQSVSRTYSYFTIGGITLQEIDEELSRRGPKVSSTGKRHPGATQMQFSTRYTYASTPQWCRLQKAEVSVKAKMILPNWRARGRSDPDTRRIWDTLNADIRRHEESHVQIAKSHARKLEEALQAIGRRGDCDIVKAAASTISARILAEHDAAQDRFDRIESINFEKRIMRLLSYRMQQIEAGRIPR
jgi:predicted secreted Zn-dependent protease